MKKLIDGLAKAVEVFLVILMALMVAVVFLATVGRYTQLFAIPWSEEFARYCMVAIVYLGLMLASLQDRHFVVELLPLVFKNHPSIIKGARILNSLIMNVFALFMLSYGMDIVNKMLSQGKLSPMLKLPLGAMYSLVPIGIVLMAVFYTYRTVLQLRESKEVGK